jgi:flagellar biosynthesis GTPase FlhF
MPSADGAPVVVAARTLKDAYRIVREEYGEHAEILGTRTVNRRQELGLGHERQVEVTVRMPGGPAPLPNLGRRPGATALDRIMDGGQHPPTDVDREIIREVARIEDLVAAIAEDHARLSKLRLPYCDSPLAETLIGNGATPAAVNALMTRFTAATGAAADDRPAALAWLTENLRASNCAWDDFYGCHAFLGDPGCGRTDLVMYAAGLLQKMGRRTLVLSVMPARSGDTRQLQHEAADKGFDAAVIRKDTQLADTDKHLAAYDAVLVDLPALGSAAMQEGGAVHAWLARNASFHRHLVVPLDKDPRDMEHLGRACRIWNCDWVAVSRLDLTGRPAKLLDLLEQVPLPVSLTGSDPARTGQLVIAHSDQLLDRLLAGDSTPGFTPGLATGESLAVAEVAW